MDAFKLIDEAVVVVGRTEVISKEVTRGLVDTDADVYIVDLSERSI